MKRWSWVAMLAALLLALAACGGDDGGGSTGSTPDPDEGTTAKATIAAADGGSVATASGKAAVEIPAGALADDTEISIEVLAQDAATATNVYEFGPDGTQFQKAVTISLAYDGTPGTEKKAVLAWYDEAASKWTEVAGSGLAGGKVSGDVNHFTKFSVIIVDDKLVAVSDCGDIVAGWTACGGDPVGTWSMKDICFPDTVIGEIPGISEVCPDARMDMEFTWDADIDIKSDGTATMDMRSQTMAMTYVIPVSCLSHPQINLADCAALSEVFSDDDEVVPCSEKAGNCECSPAPETDVSDDGPQNGTWAVEGTNFVMQDMGEDSPNEPVPFCVQGDIMTVQVEMGEGVNGIMVWEK